VLLFPRNWSSPSRMLTVIPVNLLISEHNLSPEK
jgi:hypothetical protein